MAGKPPRRATSAPLRVSTGMIVGITDHGTIVEVRALMGPDLTLPRTIHFDHSAFRWLMEGEGIPYADALLGAKIRVREGLDGQQVIDIMEWDQSVETKGGLA